MFTTFTLFQLNDVHGYLNLPQELFPGPEGFAYRPCGGYSRLATVLREWRAQYLDSLLFDGGDTFHGTRPVVDTRGEILLPVLRELGIAGMMAHWDFVFESLRACVPADVYFSNGWRYGAPVPPGPVRLEDLYDITPMDPEIETVELTGAELLGLLEQNLESTYSPDAFRQMGGYVKRALGLKVYFKVENPAGRRVQHVFVQGQQLDPARTYLAAFVTVQAVPAELGRQRRGTGHHAVAAMRAYLDQRRPLAVGQPATFVVV